MKRWSLTEHPASVGESYFQHLRMAVGFSVRLVGGGLACFVHALLPFLFTHTGSSTIAILHERMVVNRAGARRQIKPVRTLSARTLSARQGPPARERPGMIAGD